MHVLMLLTKPVLHDPRVMREARALSEAGHVVTVLEWSREPDAPTQETKGKVRIVRIRSKDRPGTLGRIVSTRTWWKKAVTAARAIHADTPIQAVHAHDLDTLPAGVRIKQSLQVPLIYDAHEVYSLMVRNHGAVVAWAAQLLEDHHLPKVDRLITVNDAFAQFYADRTPTKSTIVRNCPEHVPAEYTPPPAGPFTITYIGVLENARFFPEAIHVLGQMNGIQVRIAAKQEGLYEEVKVASARYSNIDFLGTIAYDDVIPTTLQGHAILCMFDPSSDLHRLGTPNKLYESLATGRPIIVTKGTACATFVAEHGNGFATEYSAEGLRKAVAHVRHLPATGFSSVGPTWAEQAKALQELYQGLSDERKGARP